MRFKSAIGRGSIARVGFLGRLGGGSSYRRRAGVGAGGSGSRPVSVEAMESRTMLAVDLLGYHNDLSSSGVNASETTLTPANVNSSTFGKLFSRPVDGQVYAQPLVKTGVTITTGAHQGVHDVVFVATEHDSLYAFDAHTGVQLWKDSFIDPGNGVTSVPFAELTPNPDITPEVGITGTPVIDPHTGILYLVAKTKEQRNDGTHYVQRLHAINIGDGTAALGGPAVIGDTIFSNFDFTYVSGPGVNGFGDGSVNGVVYFNAMRELNRPGLVLANGRLFIAFGSHGDNGPYHGWVLGYNPANLDLTAAWNSTPNGGLGGIWQGGGITAVDSDGYLYFETGNGTFDENLDENGFPSQGNYSDSFVKLAVDTTSTPGNQNINGWGLKVVDYFTPFNEAPLSNSDADLGSGTLTILPDSVGTPEHPHLLIGGGKEGKLYLIDRDDMGKFDPLTDHVVQNIPAAVNGLLSTPAFFDGKLYAVGGYGDKAKTFTIDDAHVSPSTSRSPDNFSFPGSTPSISANGTQDAIVWDLDRGTNQLRAYDASSYANRLWTSNDADTRDILGAVVKFAVPTVANGMVYVGTSNALVGYGLLQPPTQEPADPSNLSAAAVSASQINLTWDLNSIDAGAVMVERSTDGTNFTQVAVLAGSATTYGDNIGLASGTRYYYQVKATNVIGDSGYSNRADATTRPTIVGNWTDGDLGTPQIEGSASWDGSQFTVSGGGNDIWGTADEGHFVYQQLIGDGMITARINSQDFTDFWAKSGLMIRETPDADSKHAFLAMTPGNGVAVQYRDHTGGESSHIGSWGSQTPMWLRMARNGDNFTYSVNYDASDTPDPSGWQELWTVNIPMSTAVYAGLGVTSHHGGLINNSTFDNVTLEQAPLTVPQTPADLFARAASGTQIAVTWTDPGHNATSFTVQRSSGAGVSYVTVGTTNKTSFIDSGLASGHTYFYRVSASNPAGTSAYADPVSATPPIPPTTPSGAHATSVESDRVALAWNDNSDNELGFRIFRRLGSAGTFALVADLPPDTTSYVDNTLPPNTQVDYHIQAYNVAGYSDFSGVSLATPIGPPVNITSRPGSNRLTLSWSKVNGGTSYNLYKSTTPGGEGATPYRSNLTGTSFTDTQIQNGVTYYYQLSTNYSGGETNRSPEFVVSAGAVPGVTAHYFNNMDWAGTPDVETLVPNVDFDWGGGPPDDGIGADNFTTEFVGKVRADFSGWYTFVSNSDDDGFLWVNGQMVSQDPGPHGPQDAPPWYLQPIHLNAGQEYNFIFRQKEYGGGAVARMKWEYVTDDGIWNGGRTIIPAANFTNLIDPPAVPGDPAAAVVGTRSVSLSWTDYATSEFGYRIERSSDGVNFTRVGDQPMVENWDGQAQTVNFADEALQPGTDYYYRVVAFNPEGETASQVLHVTTEAIGPNAGLRADYFASQFWAGDPAATMRVPGVNFAWGPTGPDPAVPADSFSAAFTGKVRIITEGYYYFLSNTSDDGYLYVNGTLVSNDPGAHDSRDAWPGFVGLSLEPGEYDLVYLTNARGGGSPLARLQWVAPDTFFSQAVIPEERLQAVSDLPSNPTGLHFSDRTGDSVTLHWDDAATNEVYYDIERSTDGVHFSRVAELMPVSNPSYEGDGQGTFRDSGLSADTRYYYRVTARNFSGESGSLTGIVVSAAADAPAPGPVVDYSGGFPDAGGLSTFWPAEVYGGALHLTNQYQWQRSFAFTNAQVPARSFTTSFDFLAGAAAEGFTFTLHNSPWYYPQYYLEAGDALGYGGYYGFPNSVGLKFDMTRDYFDTSVSTTGLYFNGTFPYADRNEVNVAPSGVDFHSGHVMHVVLGYNGGELTQAITDTSTGAHFTRAYKLDLTSVLGGGMAYVGFTASTGYQTGSVDILNWTYTDVADGLAPAAPAAAPVDFAADEGSTFSGAVATFLADTAVGGNLLFSATIDWGDGSTSAGAVAPDGSGGYVVNGVHAYGDGGSYPVKVLVVDERNGAASEVTGTATIANVAPVPVLSGLPPLSPEGTALAGAGSATDPSPADAASLVFSWVVTKNGTVFASGGGPNPAFTPDDNATYVVTLTATDKDGASGTTSQTVGVANVAPAVAIAGAAAGVRGQTLNFTGSFADPGSADTWTATVDYGDGGGPRPLSLNPDKTFSLSHVYAASGTYAVKVAVRDDDGGTGTGTKSVTVTAVALQVDPVDPTKTQLVVGGTTGNNAVIVVPAKGGAGRVEVLIDGVSQGVFNPTGRIVVFGQAGNDVIAIDPRSLVPAELYGGDGNDALTGGGGGSLLVGGAGDDLLVGGSGRDILVGGAGKDRLLSDGGDDILVAGSTAYDNNPATFRSIFAEWKRTDRTYAQRVARLSSGTNPLNNSTVLNDTSADVLTGGSGQDWFLFNSTGAGVRDTSDAQSGETVTDLL